MEQMRVVVTATVAGLREWPSDAALLCDELLAGTGAQVVGQQNGWWQLMADHRYPGWGRRECFAVLPGWAEKPKLTVTGSCVDVQQQPRVRCVAPQTLLRGCLVSPIGSPREGWQQVVLAGGGGGYIKSLHLGEYPLCGGGSQKAIRENICKMALSYLGVCYRWGGKTPLGIDCSGLCAQIYLMHGIVIYRDAGIRPGFAVHKIKKEQAQQGDLLYFPGHMALYLGAGRYIHANATEGGVSVNSLSPTAPDYRRDLAEGISMWGSVF